EWPSSRIEAQAIELIPEGSEPAIVASPQSCGLAGGEYFPFTFGPELPGDQRPDDALSVCFDQPVLTEAIDIVGAPEVLVRVSSDRPQANIAIRLCDVHPDGASELISYGVLNLTHHNSHEFPQALVPGETVSARVVLDQCAYRVPSGHRLRIAVSNAYWPMIWPSPDPVRLNLSAATLKLPLRPLAQGDEVGFPSPEAASPWATETVRAANSERH
ncbi:MAG: peptidase S15, partial [Mesorhizobium sp.]